MRAPRRHSLFWTIAGMLLLTAVVGTLLQAVVVGAVLRPLEQREARARAELAASGIASAIASAPAAPRGAELDTLLARHGRAAAIRGVSIVVRFTDGTTVVHPTGAARFLPVELGGTPDSSRASREPRRTGRHEAIARQPILRGSTVIGEVQVVRRVRSRGGAGMPWSRTALLFLPIAIAASIAGGVVMVRMLVTRLRAMEVLAARVAEGDLSVRIADRSGDEIGRLAERLDRMTERLADARAQLESNEQQRRQLFADITHELATPLTSIRGYAETLSDPRIPVSTEERSRYLGGVLEESRRMDRLIRDLFELARLEAGATQLAKERLDLAALCTNTVERFEPRFRKAGLRLDWRPEVTEAWIEADGHRIVQVLENLLVNALRYVPEGGTVELALAPAADGRFRLTMRDDGPGLPPEELPRLFERFYRGSGARTTTGSDDRVGSGLGLAIVREIVERHGGTVGAAAVAPHGLAMTVELPRSSRP